MRVQLPNWIEYRMIMRIQDVLFELGMAGDMNLTNPMVRDVIKVVVGIETVILRGDVNVVYIEQDPAIRQFNYFAEELPFCHFRGVIFRIAANVLYTDRYLQNIASRFYFLRCVFGYGKSIGHR